jgi:hypothetical protein
MIRGMDGDIGKRGQSTWEKAPRLGWPPSCEDGAVRLGWPAAREKGDHEGSVE